MKKLIILGIFLLATAFGLDYFVKGDEILKETVTEAFANWAGLESELDINQNENAKTTIDYGKAELFGPDTYSLSLQEQTDSNKIMVLIKPDNKDMMRIILHETGLLLGLKLQDTGIMNPLISDTEISLGELEITELAKLHQFKKEDLNQDGIIDFYDLIELAKAFGQTGINSPADINKDGKVDNLDLELLKEKYSFSLPSATAKSNTDTANTEEQDLSQEDIDPNNLLGQPEDFETPPADANGDKEESNQNKDTTDDSNDNSADDTNNP